MASDSAKKCRDQLWLIPDQGRVGTHVVADVAVETPAMRTSAFAVPDELQDRVRIGVKVRVPDRAGKRGSVRHASLEAMTMQLESEGDDRHEQNQRRAARPPPLAADGPSTTGRHAPEAQSPHDGIG